jgi:hypothetical protein
MPEASSNVGRSTGPAVMDIDLTGSNLGPGWHCVRVMVDLPDDGDVRQMAAEHYGVPVEQISEPVVFVEPTDDDLERARGLAEGHGWARAEGWD